jgi:N-acetylglutamate synthase-like GNAT family acetyltransferase
MENPLSKGHAAEAVTTRVANLQDAEGLAVLCEQLGYPATPAQVRRRLEALQDATDHAVFVTQRASGQTTGWVHVFVRQLLVADRQAEIGGLVVLAGQRGRGVGRLLMERAEGWAWDKGCQAVYVCSNVARKRAPGFYKAMGYDQTKTSRVFWKDLDSAR